MSSDKTESPERVLGPANLDMIDAIRSGKLSGIQAAQAQQLQNDQNTLTSEIANLRRMKTARGSAQAARDGYNRVYARLERLAKTLAASTGKPVSIPLYDPPSDGTDSRMTTIDPPKMGDPNPSETHYRETGGMGASGKGLPTAATVPGSGTDGNWL